MQVPANLFRAVRSCALALQLAGSVGACTTPRPVALDLLAARPAAADWSPQRAEVEWWYVASSSPESGLAFHVAFFRSHLPPGLRVAGVPLRTLMPDVLHVAHVSVTDLVTGRRWFLERSDAPFGGGESSAHPLRVAVGDWTLRERADGGLSVRAGPLCVELRPGKPRMYHPPGWLAGERTGHAMYQSATRSPYAGSFLGRPICGVAWCDHQWGDLIPGWTARWNWHGLHLSSGDDVMLCDVTRPDGGGRRVVGTRVDAAGGVHPLTGLSSTSLASFVDGRRTYDVAFRVRADGLDLTVRPLFLRQELRSRTSLLTYWEGPVVAEGTLNGVPVTGVGLGEHLPRAEGPRVSGGRRGGR